MKASFLLRKGFVGLGLLVVFVLYAAWLAYPIALVTADIGRHIMNGAIIEKTPGLFMKLVTTNFYTYTNTDYPTVNHHWLSGLLLRELFKAGGWPWLHLSYMALSLVTLGIFIAVARRLSDWPTATLCSIALLPLISERVEIRPEGFAYLIAAVMLWILVALEQRRIDPKFRWLLVPLMVLWVNIHASFPIGLILIGAFAAGSALRARDAEAKRMVILFVAAAASTLVNPNFIAGAVEPFLIFRNPGYAVIENQSVFFLEKWGMHNASFTFLKVWTALLVVASFFVVRKGELLRQLPFILIGILLCALTFSGARHLTVLGFILVPVVASLLSSLRSVKASRVGLFAVAAVSVIAIASLTTRFHELPHRWIVIGIAPGSNGAADFIKKQHITGPFFNDFDIAGYLIYNFFPQEKVFLSNVPEAHPPEFFRDVYIPMQQDAGVWRQQMLKYDFNAIVFYYKERTAWAQQFVAARVGDPEWAPVYVDDSVLVFVRRNEKNAEIIRQFEVPPSTFVFDGM